LFLSRINGEIHLAKLSTIRQVAFEPQKILEARMVYYPLVKLEMILP